MKNWVMTMRCKGGVMDDMEVHADDIRVCSWYGSHNRRVYLYKNVARKKMVGIFNRREVEYTDEVIIGTFDNIHYFCEVS